jgi:disulfide bond formation protein DsbB
MTALDPNLKRWPLFAALASLAMLGAAHAFETFGHLAPCHLCLKQREVYWAALTIAAALVLAEPRMTGWKGPSPRWLLVLVFAASAALAAYHAGVEWKWWPGPSTCTTAPGAARVTADQMAALLNGTSKSTAPMCDKAAWVFLGISMAGWNAVASVVWTALSVLSTRRRLSA